VEYLLGILYEDIVRKRDSWNSSCDRWIFFATAAARHLMSREMLEPESPPEDAELDENFELEVYACFLHVYCDCVRLLLLCVLMFVFVCF